MDEFEKTLEIQRADHAKSLFGNFDENALIIEDGLDVRIISGDKGIRITGSSENVEKAYAVLEKLISFIEQGEEPSRQNVRYLVDLAAEGKIDKITGFSDDHVCVTARGRHIKSKTHGQRRYIRAIRDNTVVFGIGPAGTGKTFLAVAMAVNAFKDKQVNRIVLTRPAVEAGKNWVFCPATCRTRSTRT